MNYLYIENCRSEFPVVRMCQNLDVSENGDYEWRTCSKSSRKIAKEKLMAGSPLITEDLYDDLEYKSVHRSRVAALMKEMGLKCKIRKLFVITTDSKHKEIIPDNILDRHINPDMPNVAVVGDITYIKGGSNWMYLSVFIDLFSRKVVAWDPDKSR